MKKEILLSVVLVSSFLSVAAMAEEVHPRVSVARIHCSPEGQTLLTDGTDALLPNLPLALKHTQFETGTCDPALIESIREMAIKTFQFLPANVNVKTEEKVLNLCGICRKQLIETVALTILSPEPELMPQLVLTSETQKLGEVVSCE